MRLVSRSFREHVRRGTALLVVLFVMSVTTVLLVGVLDVQMLQWTAHRNTTDYERAFYLACGGAEQALAELDKNFAWRTGVPVTTFPAGSSQTYWATVGDPGGGTLVVTGFGASNGVTRKVEVTIGAAP